MEVKAEQAEKFSDLELVNLLGVSLPFHPAEKQALLEAPTLKDRENMLIDLLRLGAGPLESTPTSRRRELSTNQQRLAENFLFRNIDQHAIRVGDEVLAQAAAPKIFLVFFAVAADAELAAGGLRF